MLQLYKERLLNVIELLLTLDSSLLGNFHCCLQHLYLHLCLLLFVGWNSMGTLALTNSSNFAVHDCSSQHDLQVRLGLVITQNPGVNRAVCSDMLHETCCKCYL